jgi:uroporphyrinogen decarboxylase
MQDPRDVIDSLLRNRPAERVGLAENIWGDTLRRWVGEGYPVNDNGKPVGPDGHFGFDMTGAGGAFNHKPFMRPPEVIEETDEWIVRRDGAGAAHKYWKHKSGTPEHIDFFMNSREVWERDYRPQLLEVNRERVNIESTAASLANCRKQKKWAMFGHPFIWEIMRQSMGDVTLYESLLLDPGWIHDYNRVHTDLFKAHYGILFAEAGKPDGMRICEDLGYNKGLFCSPEVLETLIFPYFKELVEFFHSHDVPVILHACGGIEQALDLIVEAGFDGLDPMEFKAGCDALRFAEKYRDKLMFRGGLDARILESGDRDLIRREIVNLIEGMKSLGARYVFSSDHSISTNVAYADYQYALEVYREHMMY